MFRHIFVVIVEYEFGTKWRVYCLIYATHQPCSFATSHINRREITAVV